MRKMNDKTYQQSLNKIEKLQKQIDTLESKINAEANRRKAEAKKAMIGKCYFLADYKHRERTAILINGYNELERKHTVMVVNIKRNWIGESEVVIETTTNKHINTRFKEVTRKRFNQILSEANKLLPIYIDTV